MGLKIRSDKISKEQLIVGRMKDRQERVRTRKIIEGQVEDDNDFIKRQFSQILTPIAEKCNVHFNFTVYDLDTRIELPMTAVGKRNKREVFVSKMVLNFGSIAHWHSSRENLVTHLRTLEKKIRLLKASLKHTPFKFFPQGVVRVNFKTRNKYFT